jgi:antitoxin VapB
MAEADQKLGRIRELLKQRSVDALLLKRADNFAWATCGASSVVNLAADHGAAALLITPSAKYLLTDTIEAPRLEGEERLAAQGWEVRVSPWHEANSGIEDLTAGMKLAADGPRADAVDLSEELMPLRASLTPEEAARYRDLGSLCAQSMDAAIRLTRPGMTEHELSGLLAREASARGVQPIVNLVATDERIYRYRHPLPTDRRMDRYAMLVICGRKWGLVCSLTRLVHFGALPDELRRKSEAVADIDARLIAATRPGRSLGDIFKEGVAAYQAAGFADEWKLHHQGGLAGYNPRELVATPTSTFPVGASQAYAWNPSITGTKSEDTILVGDDGNEVITAIPGWPGIAAAVDAKTQQRPAILEQQ